jgi:hypothetical protein
MGPGNLKASEFEWTSAERLCGFVLGQGRPHHNNTKHEHVWSVGPLCCMHVEACCQVFGVLRALTIPPFVCCTVWRQYVQLRDRG